MAKESKVLDELLGEEGKVGQRKLFEDDNQQRQFAMELVNNILNYWANGNPVVELRVSLGTEDDVRAILDDTSTAELAGPYFQAYRELIKIVKVTGTADELPKPVVMITQRDVLGLGEPASLLQWAHDIGLAEALSKRGLVMVPSTAELRIAAVVAAILEIEDNARKTKAVVLPQPGDPRRISLK